MTGNGVLNTRVSATQGSERVAADAARKSICVYCGEITEYESVEHKVSEDGNRLRVEHIRQCVQRPELKLIAELEKAWATNEGLLKFTEHAPHCNSHTRYPSPPCDCGLQLLWLEVKSKGALAASGEPPQGELRTLFPGRGFWWKTEGGYWSDTNRYADAVICLEATTSDKLRTFMASTLTEAMNQVREWKERGEKDGK